MNAVRNDGIGQEIGYGIRPRGGALKRPGERYGSATRAVRERRAGRTGAARGPYGSGARAVRERRAGRTGAAPGGTNAVPLPYGRRAGPYRNGGRALEAGRVRGADDGSVT
ncbi:hypothetical protein AB0O64_09635 [Streptomyces sp. NPDC088341]|uniref:hypothetical protein n=1 Tax=Streptomyces sp. NPDC088341 TaxID=3154870 RepID=UPI003447047D